MPGPQLAEYRFPRLGTGFRGMWQPGGLTTEELQFGYLYTLRNYRLVGRGRLAKRYGHQALLASTINGASAIQGMAFYNLGATDYLILVSGGKIKHYNGSIYSDITGTLSPTTGDNNLCRFAQFQQGANSYILGTGPGGYGIWYWNGSGSAALLSSLITDDGKKAPTRAVDICEWRGRLWAINTNLNQSVVQFSDDGVVDSWDTGNTVYPTRSSKGMGLARHNDGAMLVFYEDSVHRIEWNPADSGFGAEYFSHAVVDGNIGAISTHSILNSQGVTYFASQRGIYRIRSAGRPAEYISYPLQDYWNTLAQGRLPYITAFELAGDNNEVGFLVSKSGQSQHDAILVWNPQLEAWSVFDSPTGHLKFNCGCVYTNSSGVRITMMGRYDGLVHEAFGDTNHSTGYLDGGSSGAAVESEFSTGMLDFGYGGLKRIKKTWLEIQLNADVSFQVSVSMVGGVVSDITPETLTAGAEGDRLSIDFIFDASAFGANDTPEQIQMRKFLKARMFKFKFVESADSQPHSFNSLRFLFKPEGKKFSAYQ